jgi:hypothetical protein
MCNLGEGITSHSNAIQSVTSKGLSALDCANVGHRCKDSNSMCSKKVLDKVMDHPIVPMVCIGACVI